MGELKTRKRYRYADHLRRRIVIGIDDPTASRGVSNERPGDGESANDARLQTDGACYSGCLIVAAPGP